MIVNKFSLAMEEAIEFVRRTNMLFHLFVNKMFVHVISQKQKSRFCCSEPPYSIVSLAQDSLDIPRSSSMDGSLRLFSGLCPRYMFLYLFERTNMICHGPTILHFPETIAFCIPHDFAHSSISDMFQHR